MAFRVDSRTHNPMLEPVWISSGLASPEQVVIAAGHNRVPSLMELERPSRVSFKHSKTHATEYVHNVRYAYCSGGVRSTPFAANNSCSDWSGSAANPLQTE